MSKTNIRESTQAFSKVKPDRWYVAAAVKSADYADDETQQRMFDGELDFDEGAEIDVRILCDEKGYATADEANAAAFEEWGQYTEAATYDKWRSARARKPNSSPLFAVYAGNNDPDPMDQFEAYVAVMKGSDLKKKSAVDKLTKLIGESSMKKKAAIGYWTKAYKKGHPKYSRKQIAEALKKYTGFDVRKPIDDSRR